VVPDDVAIVSVDAGGEVATGLLLQYYQELASRFPEGFDVGQAVDPSPEELAPPHGAFLVAYLSAAPVGCGAMRKLDSTTAEIKRMWVDPAARGHGLARRLLAELEGIARRLQCHAVRLDTSAHLPEALSLYRSSGYTDIAPYNDNPYAAHWLEKRFPLPC
jgi:GNAT superfamily N-acetyltransferase